MNEQTYFILSTIALAALLFIPVSKLMWVLAVRRFERKLKRPMAEAERSGQRQRAWFVAFFLVAIFSLLFNGSLLGFPGRG